MSLCRLKHIERFDIRANPSMDVDILTSLVAQMPRLRVMWLGSLSLSRGALPPELQYICSSYVKPSPNIRYLSCNDLVPDKMVLSNLAVLQLIHTNMPEEGWRDVLSTTAAMGRIRGLYLIHTDAPTLVVIEEFLRKLKPNPILEAFVLQVSPDNFCGGLRAF